MNDIILEDIIANISDGVIVISKKGEILYVNEVFSTILDFHVNAGMHYADLIQQDEHNDDFHQTILDCVYKKQKIHNSLAYKNASGKVIYLKVTVEKFNEVFVLTITDVTALKQGWIRQKDVSNIIVALLMLICIWVYWVTIWEKFIDKEKISSVVISYSLLLYSFIGFIFVLKTTTINIKSIGLGPTKRKHFIIDIMISLGIIITGFLCKLMIMKFIPSYHFASDTFINWKYFTSIPFFIYPINVFVQELIARGCFQEALDRVFDGKNGAMISLIVSSFLFGVFHIHKAFWYMLITPIFMFGTGLIYTKQRSIWGTCLVHYICFVVVKALGFF